MAAPASMPSGGDARIQIPQPSTATAADLIRESSAAAPSPMRGTTPPPLQLKAPSPASTTTATAPKAIDKTLASVANLAKLLPTGTALAFHSLSPSFTNRGACLASNRYLTAALLYLCFVSSVFFSFTDSFVGGDGKLYLCFVSSVFFSFTDCFVGGDGKLYFGLATAKGLLVFNYTGDSGDSEEEDAERTRLVFKNLRALRIRWVDYMHALFSAVVFLTVAFGDAAVQSCYFPDASNNVRQLLTNLPLGAGFLSSMVFLIFPTTRKGFDYTGRFTNA